MSIYLTWDSNGTITHVVEANDPVSVSEEQDLLALSVPMLVAQQLGVLTVGESLKLCAALLDYCQTGDFRSQPISADLTGAQVDLVKGNTVYCQYHPDLTTIGAADAAARQMVYNYAGHVLSHLPEPVSTKAEMMTLAMCFYYLSDVVGPEAQAGKVRAGMWYPWLTTAMTPYHLSIYAVWIKGSDDPANLASALEVTQQAYDEVRPLVKP